jgi:hypothetical protein
MLDIQHMDHISDEMRAVLESEWPVVSRIFPTSGGVRVGVETILLIVILAFAAGFVLDRLAIRRGRFDAAKSKKEQ